MFRYEKKNYRVTKQQITFVPPVGDPINMPNNKSIRNPQVIFIQSINGDGSGISSINEVQMFEESCTLA